MNLKNYVSLSLLFILCENTFAKDNIKPKPAAPIRSEMDELYVVISDFLPLVVDKAAFENQKNHKEISKQMQKLQQLTTKMVKNNSRFNDQDPSIKFISERFQSDIQLSIDMWNEGDFIVPRKLLRNVTDYCISCHTRNSKGAHFAEIVPSNKIKTMPSLAKAEFFAATRQYDDALKYYESILVDVPLAKTNPDEWDNAVRKMLAISVRVKKDPALTTELLSKIQDSPGSIPDSIRLDLAEWRKSAKAWKNEIRGVKLSESEKFSLMKKIFSDANSIARKQQGAALIEFLRLSSILHEELGTRSEGINRQEMMWMAGQASDYLRQRNIWMLQDTYYEKCVSSGGDKGLATQCYDALEASLFQSMGVKSINALPDYAKNHLNRYKALIKH